VSKTRHKLLAVNFSFKSFQFSVVRIITFSLTFGFDEDIRFFNFILSNFCIILITVDAADWMGDASTLGDVLFIDISFY
jgi:hypothetical protein